MHITDAELFAWLQQYFWTFARIAGVMTAAPLLGSTMAPARVRLLLSLVLTVILAPLAPKLETALQLFSASWFLVLAQQLLIGIAIGFVLQLAFEAVTLGGELVAYSMGLSFAQVADPVHNTDTTPLPGQLLMLVASLLFLAGGGHLILIEVLAHSLQTMPPGQGGISASSMMGIAQWGAQIFSGGMRVALPAMIALLLVNLAFGVMSRAAPSLNIQSVGFPLSLLVGLWLLQLLLPNLQAVFTDVLEQAWAMIARLTGG